MAHESDTGLRTAAFGWALVIAAPLSVASWLLVPTSMVEGTEFVDELAATSTGRATASLLTGTFFFPAAIIGVLGLTHLLGRRPGRAATLGGGLAITGLALNVIAFGAAGTLAEAVWSDIDGAATAELVETTMTGPVGMLALFGVLLAAVGTTVLGVCLYRAHAVPGPYAVLLAVYGPLQAAGFGSEIIAVIVASYVVMALALIPIGVGFLNGSFEHRAAQQPVHEAAHDLQKVPARAV